MTILLRERDEISSREFTLPTKAPETLQGLATINYSRK
jgi:hypothetical protein